MRLQPLIKFISFVMMCLALNSANAESFAFEDDATIDRILLVTKQIDLLKNRLEQGQHERLQLSQQREEELANNSRINANKNLLDKISLDISVAKSNLESLNIEVTDCEQTMSWLEKNIQETENQINVMGMFGLKNANHSATNVQELKSDLAYQIKLYNLEKVRYRYLQDLQRMAREVLALKKENHNRVSTILKSRNMLHIKQQQVKDELAYQEQQSRWQQELIILYDKLAKIDSTAAREEYAAVERDIFYANESANAAYSHSLIARYRDQIQQMKLVVLRSNSISLLNEIRDQAQTLTKQINRFDAALKSKIVLLQEHIANLSKRTKTVKREIYIKKLTSVIKQYKTADHALTNLNKSIAEFRVSLDNSLQAELSSRQGLPMFGYKSLIDLGKEMLLVPALTFQVVKSLTSNLMTSFESTSIGMWLLFISIQGAMAFVFRFVRKNISRMMDVANKWKDKINFKWLGVQLLWRNYTDSFAIANVVATLYFFNVPLQNIRFFLYFSMVWIIFKSIMITARLCLVETTHDATGHDMRLYRRLKWIILVGGVITMLTVFVNQLPLIYELKTLCDRLFLFLLMIVSLLLLRYYEVVPNLILMHMESRHPYLQKSIRLIGVLVPLLIFGNSLIGLFGYVNLIMTVSRYEGIFLLVLIGYLILRGLLSDGMEQLSRLLIQYVNNGWLWTEAFLKPIDRVLRITLFLSAWAVLFLLYGWDKQSPIVERLTRLLHYQLVSVLNTTITPLNILELLVVISIFYWTAKWTREFVYRMLLSRTKDMGIRNSIAILSQYSVIVMGIFICLQVLGIDLRALTVLAGMFGLGIGLGLRDLANNFASGFLILLERPLRVGDIVNINNVEGEVTHIGSRAVTIRTWDLMEHVVPNAEIFNKSFMNWTAKDNIIRSVVQIKIGRHDNPHELKLMIQNVLTAHKEILKEPVPDVFLKEINDTFMMFELRYFVNVRQIKSRTSVMSSLLIDVWDAFAAHGIKAPYPKQEVFIKTMMEMNGLKTADATAQSG